MRCFLITLLILSVASCDAVDVPADANPSAEVLAEALVLMSQDIPEGVGLDPSLVFGPSGLMNAAPSSIERLEEAMALAGIESGDGRAARACAHWTESRGVPVESVINTPPPPGCEEGRPPVFVVSIERNDMGEVLLRAVGWSRETWHDNLILLDEERGAKVRARSAVPLGM